MRDITKMEYVLSDGADLEIKYIPYDKIEKFSIPDYDLMDEKDFRSYISDIERLCRQSYEYRSLIKFLKEDPMMNSSGLLSNVSGINMKHISIELHHEPFTLFDIANIVVNKRLSRNECMDIELVCKEIMYNHYCLYIGLYPAAKTEHELIHNNYLFIPMQSIFGNVDAFVDRYMGFISQEYLNLYDNIKKASLTYDNDGVEVFNRKYIYIDMGENIDRNMRHLSDYLKNNIDAIRSQSIEQLTDLKKEPKSPFIVEYINNEECETNESNT